MNTTLSSGKKSASLQAAVILIVLILILAAALPGLASTLLAARASPALTWIEA